MALALSLGKPSQAQSVVSTGQSFVTARMLPGIENENGTRTAGIRLTLAEGWKTYWRSPGEAGIPPNLDWSQSRNLAEAKILWPRPELFVSFGMQTIGYSESVVLPIAITPEDPGKAVHMHLTADFGVCKEICVVERVELQDILSPGMPAIGRSQIERALRQVPVPVSEAGVTEAVCAFSGQREAMQLSATIAFQDDIRAAQVIVEGNDQLWLRRTQSRVEDGRIHVTAEAELPPQVAWIDRSAVRFTVLTENTAVDIQGCTGPNG